MRFYELLNKCPYTGWELVRTNLAGHNNTYCILLRDDTSKPISFIKSDDRFITIIQFISRCQELAASLSYACTVTDNLTGVHCILHPYAEEGTIYVCTLDHSYSRIPRIRCFVYKNEVVWPLGEKYAFSFRILDIQHTINRIHLLAENISKLSDILTTLSNQSFEKDKLKPLLSQLASSVQKKVRCGHFTNNLHTLTTICDENDYWVSSLLVVSAIANLFDWYSANRPKGRTNEQARINHILIQNGAKLKTKLIELVGGTHGDL